MGDRVFDAAIFHPDRTDGPHLWFQASALVKIGAPTSVGASRQEAVKGRPGGVCKKRTPRGGLSLSILWAAPHRVGLTVPIDYFFDAL